MEPYANLKALWLESNGLTRIENLTPLTSLRCLYLNKNLIERVEGLESLRELNTLDLSDNRIATLAGLAHLPVLSSLNLSRNLLALSSDVQELAHCAQLTNVDLSHNRLEDVGVLAVLQQVPQLRALRLTGNALVSTTKSFRKTYIASLPQLAFLDRPIFPMERAAVAAWQTGGSEAELEAKRLFVAQENDERKRALQEFRDWQSQVREKRIRELDEERARKDQELRDAQENTSTNCSSANASDQTGICTALDAIDLKGFRGITKEQYACLGPADRAKWDGRIERAQADSDAERREVLGDSVPEADASFWAASKVSREKAARPARSVTPTKAIAASIDGTSMLDQGNAVAETPVCAQETADDDDAACAPHGSREAAIVWSTLSQSAGTATESSSGSVAAVSMVTATSALPVVHSAASFTSLRPPPTPNSVSSHAPLLSSRLSSAAQEPATPPSPPAPSTRSPAPFFCEVGDARESWARLEQRAWQAPFLHRPLALPSVHSVRQRCPLRSFVVQKRA